MLVLVFMLGRLQEGPVSTTWYAILVVWNDGRQEYFKSGTRLATFASRPKAFRQRGFMLTVLAPQVAP